MSLLTPTGIEDHPLATPNANAIINANWTAINNWLKKTPYRLESGTIDGKSTGTTTIANGTGFSILPRAFLIQPVTFDTITTPPTIEIGDSSDQDEFLASSLLTLNADTLIERLSAESLITPVADGNNIEVEVTVAATATTYDFKILAIVDFLP
jgi:hypothetical protein